MLMILNFHQKNYSFKLRINRNRIFSHMITVQKITNLYWKAQVLIRENFINKGHIMNKFNKIFD